MKRERVNLDVDVSQLDLVSAQEYYIYLNRCYASVTAQIERAHKILKEKGIYQDRDWYSRINNLRDQLENKLTQVDYQLSVLETNRIDRSAKYNKEFRLAAKEVLPKQVYDSIVALALRYSNTTDSK